MARGITWVGKPERPIIAMMEGSSINMIEIQIRNKPSPKASIKESVLLYDQNIIAIKGKMHSMHIHQ
jgi:hypothetical protein